MPYSGPASAYGVIGKVVAAYFDKVNAEGGINGRKIKFISYDDGYNPAKTLELTRKLVEEDDVRFIFASLGTNTSAAAQPYLNSKKIPQLFVASGASMWDRPREFPWSMGFLPGYQSESHIYAQYLLENHPKSKIAVLYQDDGFGKDHLKGLKDGLGGKIPVVAEAPYKVTDASIDALVFAGTEGILAGNPDVANVITMPQRPGFARSLSLLARLLRRYDLALSTQAGDRPTLFAVAAARHSAGPVEPHRLNGRIKRALLLDQTSVRFLDDEHRTTNLGRFRAYVTDYLRAHPRVNQDMTLMVRQLEPTPHGLPMQVYCFSADVGWVPYENLAGDIFDHLLAVLPEFGLRIYQQPGSGDVAAALGGLAGTAREAGPPGA